MSAEDMVVLQRSDLTRIRRAVQSVERSGLEKTYPPSAQRQAAFLSNPSSGGLSVTAPFSCLITQDSMATEVVRIQPGMANQMLASNCFAYTGGLPYFALSTSLNYCGVVCGTDGKSVTSCTIEVVQTFAALLAAIPGSPSSMLPNAAGAAPSGFGVLFATIVGPAGARTIYQHALGNIVAIPKQIVLVPKGGTISAGQENFDRWWSWVVVQQP